MSRANTAIQLLKLGSLTLSQFRQITGWPEDECLRVLIRLQQDGICVKRQLGGTGHAELIDPEGVELPPLPTADTVATVVTFPVHQRNTLAAGGVASLHLQNVHLQIVDFFKEGGPCAS
jgi:hypothetical protein